MDVVKIMPFLGFRVKNFLIEGLGCKIVDVDFFCFICIITLRLRMQIYTKTLLFFYLFIFSSISFSGGEIKGSLNDYVLRIFIDYEECDMDYIKAEIPYVNYVIERRDADVYILITKQPTAGGGTEYTLVFIGQKLFTGMSDTLRYNTLATDSDDTIRRGIVKKLKAGLVRYISRTPLGERLSIDLLEEKAVSKPYDRWHNWIFGIDVYTYVQGQQKYNFNNINTSLSIKKVLENWKWLNNFNYYYRYNVYKLEDTILINESKSFSGMTNPVIGISDYFSICGYGSFYSSSYENIYLSSGIALAIEYNIYPYSQSTSRKLTFQYEVGYIYFEYYELTIFDKLKERLFKETGSVNAYIRQPWGSVNLSLRGSHYFHDFKKNRLTLNTDISLPILKRLSFKIFSYVAMIHDQLSLPKRQLTEEEIILQKKLLATQYSYFISIGISYTFGSIYSNIVNPRFE